MLELKKFTIKKLNGDQNVTIEFIDNKKVVVAENGSGKTTIMNILFYCLKNNIRGLQKYDFDSCILNFNNDNTIIFSKNNLNKIGEESLKSNLKSRIRLKSGLYDVSKNIDFFSYIANFMFKYQGALSFKNFLRKYILTIKEYESISIEKRRIYINNLFNEYGFMDLTFEQSRIIKNLIDLTYDDLLNIYHFYYLNLNHPNGYLFDSLEMDLKIDNPIKREFAKTFVALMKESFNYQKDSKNDKKFLKNLNIIFLPTYRRIEQDSVDLISGEFKLKEDSTLSFGVNDVAALFNAITKKIKDFSNDSFNKINSGALNDFISGNHNYEYSIDSWQDEKYFLKVLNRVGGEILENNKKILKKIFKEKHSEEKFLLKLIKKMCEIYDTQLLLEQEIHNYIRVCNKYLYNKEIVYNEDSLRIEIFKNSDKAKNKDIPLASLSSGEKQIISLFAELYLSHLPDIDLENPNVNETPGYWILFDEPELSLSVKWQEMILPDIIASERCEFLFATTHSPFIFDNELLPYTSDISLSIQEVNNND